MSFQIDVITLFPDLIEQAAQYGVTGRAKENNLWQLKTWNPRDFTHDPYRTVDDRPYGGGPGMVMLAQPLKEAIQAAKKHQADQCIDSPKVIFLSPQGALLTHQKAVDLSLGAGLILLSARYEGVDQRLIDRYVDEEISIGEYVLSGGELPALVLMDAVLRHLPGVLGDSRSAEQESFVGHWLDTPHYTRPEVFEDMAVPPVLLSGHHAQIERWRHEQAVIKTWQKRPDMLAHQPLSGDDKKIVESLIAQQLNKEQ
ncbi:MAG: tRNA (guanine(37)-N(1))-methyltransferase [Ferrovum sp. 37-45-19]|uniref:tRNA (guanosine(37)-N1)-methyltransferase TrmD n=1 Tax=Ferrovum sp. JA12 TaxID=1356299 RepID=UPI00070298AD|nr:tRNA (guanosine(37)-N1)-methyltransferase TrmD [Ferrovum sp. JA12]OYV80571.1 MAG: tRNA (guanine(37)-N(1))-methyltransferase [Ferrovum sp. 21-44-67]OYV94886.1 MAG: tRNA (guanine(37)-N(1))-methyltransferase [Ferrovum sp. 37-45-19]OZB34082.1 MAG: tRNA (guanine(37)-N(1))-methyltransferase [Ferrovum sp. 34-44-207]HQT80981.1 tRNA (guanosine(37)-N1)-methyltransferase TrmD [Ferrovaceae bacterium]KRH79294.1 tRNA (guanine-N(1)-)-methyltransferase [Ferrovum sp. JA12]